MRYLLGILILSLASCSASTPTIRPQANKSAAEPANRIPLVTLSANGLSLDLSHKAASKSEIEYLGHESSAAALLLAASKSSIPQMRIATRGGVASQMVLTIRDEFLKESRNEKQHGRAYVLLADNSVWVWHSAQEFQIHTVGGEYDWPAIQQAFGLLATENKELRTLAPEDGGKEPFGVLFVVAHESASVQELVTLLDSARQANFAYVSLGESDGPLFGSAGQYLLKATRWPIPWQKGVTIQGSIAQELVEKYLDEKRPEMQACYEQQRSTVKVLSGTVMASFTIALNGRVSEAQASGMASPTFHSCVRTILSGVRYPRQEEQAKVTYSLTFGNVKKKAKVRTK